MQRTDTTRCSRLLQKCGISPPQTWYAVLWSIFFVSKAPPSLKHYFPHVNWHQLRISDLIRIPLQLLWLVLVIPPEQRAPYPSLRHFLPKKILALNLISSKQLIKHHIHHEYWDISWIKYSAYFFALLLLFFCITTPFNLLAQSVFLVSLWGIAWYLWQRPGSTATLFLMVLAVVASSRYIWWRINYTLNWDNTAGFIWGGVLLLAELYTWIVLIFGYIQTSWPLKRKPATLPADSSSWPSVDVYIPSYNEPLSVIKPTIYAAMCMDWPRDKLNVYLLDDGHREEMRRFAQQINIGYLTRDNNLHAKAGNLNCALKKTHGSYIAIFDCDHVATRSYLQMTIGWFLRDPKLALVQTPHHFFSPDPFERNLNVFRQIPNEGELFYGLIQDSNDFWNATFFCGSCAVIQRNALEEINGIAVETVTEDAHTALKMQRLGYNTAYLNLPQAAGLATESLSSHIAQRIRWARGMVQIFRLDNPFLGKGLNWAQRICYSNAMVHFLNGAPRLIFLTSPLAFLLFEIYIIYAQAIAILLYALPNIIHASMTNSRLQGKYRHSFWAEIYETVLSWYIVRPTSVALLVPSEGKFNVTSKGGLIENKYHDWLISAPYLAILLLNVIACIAGVIRLVESNGQQIDMILINMAWSIYNLILIGGAIAVATEAKQVRRTHRVSLTLPAILHLSDGKLIRCATEDFSEGGCTLTMPAHALSAPLNKNESVKVTLWRGADEFVFSAQVINNKADKVHLQWQINTTQQEMMLIQCTFGRADAWVSWAAQRPHDKPLSSLKNIFAFGILGYNRLAEALFPAWGKINIRQTKLSVYLLSFLPRNVARQNN